MLDQDTARALLTIADETCARVAFVGDRHQLPAVGRGGVLDHAINWAHPTAVVSLEKVHRFADPAYAALSLRMREGEDPTSVFDELHRGGQIAIHASDVERTVALAEVGAAGDLVIADRREQVADLNAAIRDQLGSGKTAAPSRPPAESGSASGTVSPPAATIPTSKSRTARPGRSRRSMTTAASSSATGGASTRSRSSTRSSSSSSPTRLRCTARRATLSAAPTSL